MCARTDIPEKEKMRFSEMVELCMVVGMLNQEDVLKCAYVHNRSTNDRAQS
jgi:hypothetical protein